MVPEGFFLFVCFMSCRLLETSPICLLLSIIEPYAVYFTAQKLAGVGWRKKKSHSINQTDSASDSPQFHSFLPLSLPTRKPASNHEPVFSMSSKVNAPTHVHCSQLTLDTLEKCDMSSQALALNDIY